MNFKDFKEFKFGWPVLLAAGVGIGLGMSPLPFYTIGVFIGEFIKEFGWKVNEILLGIWWFAVAAFIAAPVVGYLADKYGPRKVVLVSLVTFSLGMMSFSLSNGSLIQYYLIWVLLAICGVGTLPITYTKIVIRWFSQARGLALGVALVGTGLFGAAAKLFAAELIGHYGWRGAYIGLGFLPLLISLPLAYFFLRDTDDPKVANKVANLKKVVEDTSVDTSEPGGMNLAQTLVDYRFWILCISFFPIALAVGGSIPILEQLFTQKGFSTGDGVKLASLIGVAVVIGRLTGGYLIDKYWAPMIAAIFFSLPIIACFIYQQAELSYMTAAVATMIIGFAAGVEYDLMAFLVSKYFGMKYYGSIYGAIYGVFALGAGIGPFLFGYSFDQTGSYDTIFTYAMIFFAVGAFPLLFLGKYREFPSENVTITT